MKWQPIATAPKDRVVLVGLWLTRYEGDRVWLCSPCKYYKKNPPERRWTTPNSGVFIKHPTHWAEIVPPRDKETDGTKSA